MRAPGGTVIALGVTLGLAIGGLDLAWAADDPDHGPITVTVEVPDAHPGPTQGPDDPVGGKATNAELAWSINREVRGKTYFGNCNFVMAGRPGTNGNAGSASAWEKNGASLYHSTSGNVSMVGGSGAAVPYGQRCLGPDGQAVKGEPGGTFTDHQMRIVKGNGNFDTKTGQAQIAWQGAATVVFYDGLVYFWLRNPVLKVSAGGATLTATVGGWGSDRDDPSKWRQFSETTLVVAQATGVKLEDKGVVLKPSYAGVALSGVADQKLGAASTHPGAWPQAFVNFQKGTGLSQYWYSTGNNHDYRKPPDAIYVSWDADKSINKPPPVDGANSGGAGDATAFNSTTTGGGGGSGGAGGGATEPAEDDSWPYSAESVMYQAGPKALVPTATAERRAQRLAAQIALLTLIVTIGFGLVAWRRGWFRFTPKGIDR
ncbi:MAG: hypothetical protein FWD29_05295 [Micrococcales bacterium]|nr:hypothetical protein [Micrococcales bacterium]